MQRIQMALIFVVGVLAGLAPGSATAADTWLEMQSPHFKAVSNAGEGSTRNVLWQFEQIRSAMAALWPWMKTDLAKPVLVIGAKDEATMRSLAPEYWERRGSVHPVSVWVIASCQKNDEAACTQLAPLAEKRCGEGEKRACLVTAMLQFRGSGVPKDEARGLSTLEQLCDGGLFESCTQWAVILASRQKPDMATARQLLTKSCDGGLSQACEMLKSLPK